MNLFVYTVKYGSEEKNYISPLKTELVFKNGLNSKGVLGYLKDSNSPITKDNVVINPEFTQIFHETIKTAAMNSMSLASSAQKQNEGFVYIIDQGVSNSSNNYDIIGVFRVTNGHIVPDSYQINSNYEIISRDGACELPKNFEDSIIEAIAD